MQAKSAPSSTRVARRGFAIGWLSITLVTALVFSVFAGPLIRDGRSATLSQRITTLSPAGR